MSKILDLINALARAEDFVRGREFIAPLANRGRVQVRVNGVVYRFLISGGRSGWWLCRALNTRTAVIAGEALPWQRGEYLRLWPHLRLVLLEPLRRDAWLAIPFNPSDAMQRFAIRGPVVVQLVEAGQRFERIVGRVEGNTIWYDEPDRRTDPAIAEQLRAGFAAAQLDPNVPGLGAGERAAYVLCSERNNAERNQTIAAQTEQRLRAALAIGGAQLRGYELVGEQLRVAWERNGRRSVTLIDTDLGVTSAGICLNGEDDRFDLSSIVGVVDSAPGFARYELEE
ncbi:MAG: hypothetical protein HC822_01180 [Oscillochloris sp.]|nr:hypothetical protein [Oscillochloris sp.]